MTTTSSAPSPLAHASVGSLNLSQKVGQMLIVGFDGQKPSDAGVASLRQKAESGECGGVIFFAYNIASPSQVRDLITYMASWKTPLPLLFAVDQEGGAVQRLTQDKGFCGTPSVKSLADASAQVATQRLDALSAELQSLGFNFNFAPCVDLHDPSSPAIGGRERSFGDNSDTVCRMATLQMASQAKFGVRSSIKHFPGHGLAQRDSHKGMTDISQTYQPDELAAFEKVIASGPVDAVMTSHLVHEGLDAQRVPVTFSPTIIQGLLRQKMGFDGIVVTDDLGMGALVHHYDFDAIVSLSLASGHDLLVFGQNAAAAGRGQTGHLPQHDLHANALAAVQAGIRAGTMSDGGVDESLRRILRLKTGL